MAKDDLIKSEILYFYERLQDDPYHRFRSWEHCFKYFQSKNIDIDIACLHLGFYLASWGMYRGSSFLLQKDYLIHMPAVEEILKDKYKPLRNASFAQFLDAGGDENIELLFDLIGKIKICYEDIGDYQKLNKKTRRYNNKKAYVTDTLVTKILLGTLGCIPAYDRYFITGLKSHEGLTYSYLNKTNFKKMVKFCHEDLKEFEQAQKVISKNNKYPLMKLVDMYFWRLGEKIEGKKVEK